MAKDYYKILGVERTASPEEIKKAYRRLAHTHHPDKAGGNEEKFKEINEAYQILSDQTKRGQYDQFGQTFDQGGGNPFSGAGAGNFDFGDLGGLGDMFEQFFGGGGRQRGGARVRQGQDVAIDLTISFQESAEGAERDVAQRLYQTCRHCHGSGAEPGTPISNCPTCQGQGSINRTHQTPFGLFQQAATCPDCHGEGKRAKTACSQCRGQGRVLEERKLAITVPAGIADGQTLRLSGKGEVPPRGGLAGDLYVNIHVKPDPDLQREGDTVRSRASISFVDAALGATISVRTLQGEKKVDVPAGTQPEAQLRLRGLGLPSLRGGNRSDHVVTISVVIPKKLTKKQRQALTDFKGSAKKHSLFGL